MRPLIHVLLGFLLAGCLAGACNGPNGDGDALPSDAVSNVEVGDIAEPCPAGLVPWPGGGCAPLVPECKNPWELPLIGGGCVAIGPRACPKLWDPEADVDCEPGQLMEYDGNACPEGFVLTDDEVACIPFFEENCGEMEIPVLGGGCKKVGPDWYDPEAPNGGLDVPFFDDCGPGLLALEGGGCIQVGPRACPKLWDPESDVDCEVGDVLPCPEGWSESEDGMYCDPKYGECGPGERSLVGGGCERVVPLAEDCPPGPFPEVPEGAKDVVYVSAASTCTEGCGSKEAPFQSIPEAIKVVPDGGYVLVGAGGYEEGLLIQKPVHVLGLCAALVVLSGWTTVPGENPKVPQAGVAVVGTEGVELGAFHTTGPVVGVAVLESKGVILHHMDIAGSAGLGLYAGPGSEVTAEALWLHETVATQVNPWMSGYGVWVASGASVQLHECLVESAMASGVYVAGKGAKVTLEDAEVKSTQQLAGGGMGFGVFATDEASMSMERTLLQDNFSAGLRVDKSASVWASGSVVRGTKPDNAEVLYGYGIMAGSGAKLSLQDCLFEGNEMVGVTIGNPGTQVEMDRTTVRETKSGDDGWGGLGASVYHGATASLRGCLFEGNRESGLSVTGFENAGAFVDASGTLIRDTGPDGEGRNGHGVWATIGASAELSWCVLEKNTTSGCRVSDSGTKLKIFDSVVRNTKPNEDGEFGRGVSVAQGASAEISDCLLERNEDVGVWSGHSGTNVDVFETVIRDTQVGPVSEHGIGIHVGEGATLNVVDSLLESNSGIGINIRDPDTLATVHSTAVIGTGPTAKGQWGFGIHLGNGGELKMSKSLLLYSAYAGLDTSPGHSVVEMTDTVVSFTIPDVDNHGGGNGLRVTEGAEVSLDSCLLAYNTACSLWAGSSETGTSFAGPQVHLLGTVVRDTQPDGNLDYGQGLQISHGATLLAERSLVDSNTGQGVMAVFPGTSISLEKSMVRNTKSHPDGRVGLGMGLYEGTVGLVRHSSFAGNSAVGLGTYGQDSRLEMSFSAIVATSPTESGLGGHGMEVSDGADVSLSGCLFAGNSSAGLLVGEADSSAALSGTVVAHTQPDAGGGLGMGVVAQMGASASLLKTLLQHNVTAGLLTVSGGTALLRECAVLDTLNGGASTAGGAQVFGDGIVAADGGKLDIESVFSTGNARNGIYFNQSPGSVIDSVIVGNEFYGLAMEECADEVKWEGQENYIVGNATGMPPDKAAQVTTSTGGMAVPPVPEMMDVPSEPVE